MPHPYNTRLFRLILFLCLLPAVFTYASASDSRVSGAGFRFLDVPQVSATPSVAGTIYVTWSSVASATQYTIEYSKISGSGFTPLKTVASGATSYRHTNLGYSEKLYYRVKVSGSGGETAYSPEVTATTHPANYSYRIMPLGDSNTDGGSASVPRANRISYRHELYQLLTSAKYKTDFVGSEISGTNMVAAFRQKYGYDPDVNHAGFGGAKNEDIEALLKNGLSGNGPYLDQYKPDIILLHIGTNSLGYPNDISALTGILDQVNAYEARAKREVTVVLAQIIKQCSDCNEPADRVYWDTYHTAEYNRELVQLANSRIAAGDRIVLVDMAVDAGLNYSSAADMADYLHPSQSGFDKMAKVWFNPVKSLLTISDTHTPETQIISGPAAVTTSKTATFTFASNEAGITYQASLDGAAYATVTSPATFNNIPDGVHTLKVQAVDASGNTDATPAAYTWTIDATPPASPVIVAISEDRGPSATDHITTDTTIKLKGTSEANATISINLAGKGKIGTATANGSGNWEFSYEGTALTAGSYSFTATAADALGNTSAASAGFAVTIDLTAPTVALTTTSTSPVNKAFEIKIAFSEPVYDLALADFSVVNGSISKLESIDPANYTATITPATDGKVTVQLPAAKVTDLAGNQNAASGALEITSDITKPKVTISTNAVATLNTGFEVTITFNEVVTGFDVSDVTVGNGTASELKKVDDKNYIVLITPTAQGEVTISIAAGIAQDAAGNGNEASNILKRQFDSVAPAGYVIAFGVDQVNVSNENAIPLNVTSAENGATYTYTITSSNGGTPVSGKGIASAAAFTIPALDLAQLNDGTLTVTIAFTDAAGNKGEDVTAQVQKVTREIAAVTPSGLVKVPFGTAFTAITLPQKVKVTYTTGEEDFLNVTWEPGNYNATIAGQYAISGTLELAPNTTNFNNRTGSIIVEVEPNLPPTQLSLNATQFKADALPTDVIGIFTTQDPEDTDFTYTLVNGQGDEHNSYFTLTGDQLHLVSNSGLSGISNFNIRVQSKDPYNNTIEQTFVLTKMPYEQRRIELVNAFSPDGDGINDTWTVPELRFFNDVEITVMDKAGVRLYQSSDPENGWDGKGKNGQVQQGPYFYIIQVKDINLVQKGVVTVLK